jgi:hypothetical protein
MTDVREFGGDRYILRGGRYQRATAAEAEILRGDSRSVAIKTALADLYGLGNMLRGAVALGVPGAAGQAASDRLFQRAAENFDTSAQLRELRPGPAGQGTAVLDALALIPIGGAGTRATTAQRVRAQLTPAATIAQQQADEAVEAAFRGSTVGAAQAGQVSGMGKFFRNLTTQLDTPRNLSADQFEILETGLWRKVGFEFPTGSLNSEGLYASILANPFLRGAAEPALRRNAATLGELFMRSVDIDPADFPRGMGRGVIGAARRKLGGRFERVADAIGDSGRDLGEIVADIGPSLTRAQRLALAEQGNKVTGRQIMDIRSTLNKALTRAWRGDDQALVNILEDGLQFIDDDIARALQGTDVLPFWRDTQEMWRTFKVLDRPGVIDPNSGDLSLKVLTNRLGDQYRDFFETSPEGLARLTFRNQATRELLEFSRVARSFADAIGDSGTATRSTLQMLATNPKALGKFGVLRHALDAAMLEPDDALALAR